MVAGEDLDQGRLPGSVLADEPVSLAGQHGQPDFVQRLRPAEALRDPSRDESRRFLS
jgi:hypothetical protein